MIYNRGGKTATGFPTPMMSPPSVCNQVIVQPNTYRYVNAVTFLGQLFLFFPNLAVKMPQSQDFDAFAR
jgi:hypothetical protein